MSAAIDIGGRLHRAREDRGLSLHDVAGATKLSTEVLKAIERNDFGSLPPGIYRRAYIRTFASEVDVDPDEVAEEFARRCAAEEESLPVEESPPGPIASPNASLWTLVLFVLLAAAWVMFA